MRSFTQHLIFGVKSCPNLATSGSGGTAVLTDTVDESKAH